MSSLTGRNFRQRSIALALGTLVAGCAAAPTAPSTASVPVVPSGAATAVAQPTGVMPDAPAASDSWHVSEADGNLRLVIQRWARQVEWRMVWDVDHDIPITADASLTGPFKNAVRQLVSATELTDYPLKPCFYSNSVVRIVPLTTKCDPNG
jgi:hypothetical protein